MAFEQVEFEALRATIRQRGTLRYMIPPIATGLAAVVLAAGLVGGTQTSAGRAALLALVPLAAGVAVLANLHETNERIGQYLRVYYEESRGQSLWESRIATAPAPPPRSPIFVGVFLTAGIIGLAVAFGSAGPVLQARPLRPFIVLVAYVAYIIWALAVDRRCRGAKARELARWHALGDRGMAPGRPPQPDVSEPPH